MKLAAVLFFLVGCQGSAPLLFAYQGEDDGRAAAALAVAEWRDACGVDVRLDPTGVPLAESDEGVPAGKDAMTSSTPQWIHVRPGSVSRAIFAHEIGHALGLPHTAAGLMTGETIALDAHVSAADCAAVDR